MYEVETKVLGVDPEIVKRKMETLGSKFVQQEDLFVDWFRFPGVLDGEDPWYLRVRSYGSGKVEVTWKGKSESLGISRRHKEINLIVSNHEDAKDLFESIGLVCYAHQEKKRISWEFEDWRFDLDTYPKMPPYLEIEGKDEGHIQEIIDKLDLKKFTNSSEGEKKIIEGVYKLNWNDMRF